jgi:hypothetical protein
MKLKIIIPILIISMTSCKTKQTKFVNDTKIDSVSNVIEIKNLDSIAIKTDSMVENIEEEIEYQIVSDSIGKFYSLPIKVKRKITKEKKSKSVDLKHFNIVKQESVDVKKKVQQTEEKIDNSSKFKWIFFTLVFIFIMILLLVLFI